MGSRALQRMNFSPALQACLLQHNFLTARDVMVATPSDLCELLDLSFSEVQQLLLQVALHVTPPFSTALELRQQQQATCNFLPTTLQALDAALRGGVPAAGITELVGPAGVGKSQMCFLLTLLTALPVSCGGAGSVAIFVDTEKKFSSTRVLEMARARVAMAGGEAGEAAAIVQGVMGRILVTTPSSVEELVRCFQGMEAAVAQHHAAVVVVDSIAALMRAEFGAKGQVVERQELLGSQASVLKHLAESFRLPVVVTNQVTTRMPGAPAPSHHRFHAASEQQPPGGRQASYLAAALGTKWAHCVNTRLIMERHGDRRFLKVAKSPAAANEILEYHITAKGVEQLNEGGPIPPALQQSVVDMAIANDIDYGMYLQNH